MRTSSCAATRLAASCACVFALSALADRVTAQSPNQFATRVVSHDDRGGAGGGVFDPNNALGRPDGGSNVHSLGNGGSLTLGFAVQLVDGPGADLIVSENPFASISDPWQTFAEVCFVEVSSDGTHFARFPSRYTGPDVEPGSFAFVDAGYYSGFAGVLTTDVTASDPFDVVDAGGDAFDLHDLHQDPLVTSGLVNLQAITEVRLVDAVSGVDVDSTGATVRDPSTGSADIDGVTVLQHAQNQSAHAPLVELLIPADGNFRVRFSDPDGLLDLDPTSFRAALWGIEVPITDVLAAMNSVQVDAQGVTLQLGGALPADVRLHLKFSVKDLAGNRSGAQRVR